MRPEPLVSVCIPAYKKPQLLKRCLDSVYQQSFRDFEVIVTDDSPDDSVNQLIYQYQNLDWRFKYQKNIKALGSPGNWNEALRLAKGEFGIVLHHDDYWITPDTLANMVSALSKDSEACLAFGYSDDMDSHGKVVSWNHPTSLQVQLLNKDPSILVFQNMIGAPSVVIFRRHPQIFFNPSLVWQVDVEFYLRLFKVTQKKAICVPSARIGISVENGRMTDYCLANPDVVISETLTVFCSLGMLASDPRLLKFFREFSSPSIRVWAVANGFPGMGIVALFGFLSGYKSRCISKIKRTIKRLLKH